MQSHVSRSEAKASGLKRYFTGTPCPHGHFAERAMTNGECVTCCRIRARRNVKLWRKAQPDIRERRAAEARRRRKNHPEAALERDRAERAKHRDKIAVRQKSWRERNKDSCAAYDARWKAENPEAFREKCRRRQARRRARKMAADGTFSAADINALFDAQGGRCNGCEEPFAPKFEIDHIVPLARGGTQFPSNLQLLCRSCNARKGALTMEEWVAQRG